MPTSYGLTRGPGPGTEPSNLREVDFPAVGAESPVAHNSNNSNSNSNNSNNNNNNNNNVNIHVAGAQQQQPPMVNPTQTAVHNLEIHDEGLSQEDVLFNQDAFPDFAISAGDVLELSSSVAKQPLAPTVAQSGASTSSNAAVASGSSRPPREGSSSDELDADSNLFNSQERYLFLLKPLPEDIRSLHPDLNISVSSSVAKLFGFKSRMQVTVTRREPSECYASHVELVFRDQFLARADQWQFAVSELAGKPVYRGQTIMYIGNIMVTVKAIYREGKKVSSGLFSPQTVPVFRTESARYVLFIQMSKEMWEYDSEGIGDILFDRVINSLLPDLFKRWTTIDAHHLVTVVLFAKVEYRPLPSRPSFILQDEDLHQASRHMKTRQTKDFYKTVVNDMPSGNWTAILDQLKYEYKSFLRDVTIPRPDKEDTGESAPLNDDFPVIRGRPIPALRGNILEAINMASSYLDPETYGRGVTRAGTSIAIISPSTGVFEVNYDALSVTSETLTSRGIGIDMICLSPRPLHPVPLLKFKQPVPSGTSIKGVSPASGDFATPSSSTTARHKYPPLLPRPKSEPEDWAYGVPHWIDISFWNPRVYHESGVAVNRVLKSAVPGTVTKQSQIFVPRVRMYEMQMTGIMESERSNISIPYLPMPSSAPGPDPLRPKMAPKSLYDGPIVASTPSWDSEFIDNSKHFSESFMNMYDRSVFKAADKINPRKRNQKHTTSLKGTFNANTSRADSDQVWPYHEYIIYIYIYSR